MIEQLLSIVLYLPFGLLLATVVLEVSAAKRRTTESNNAVIAALKASAVGIALAAGAAAYVTTQNVAGVRIPFGSWMPGLGVLALALVALLLKILCRNRKIKGFPSKHLRRSKGAESFALKGALLGAYRFTLAAAVIALFACILLAKPISAPPTENSGLIADNTGNEPQPSTEPTAEPAVAPEPAPEPEPKPEPVVAVVEPTPEPMPEPTPEPAPEPAPEPTPEPTPAVAVVTTPEPAPAPDPNNPFDSPDAIDLKPEMAGTDPDMESTPAEPVIATPTPTPQPAADPSLKQSRSDYYATLIAPLMRDRCYDCHGAEKQKGDLRLDSPEWIRKGGKSGPILVAGDPEKSSLYSLVALPEDDPDIMPPKGKPLTEAQVGYIRRWILDGAELGDGKEWPGAAGKTFAGTDDGATLPPAVAALIDALKAAEVGVKEVPGEPGMYEVDYSHAGRAEGQMNLQQLQPLADHLHTLDLKKTKIVDSDLQHIGSFTKLSKLNLALTKVSDTGIGHLSRLENLTYLNLYGTEVGDRSVNAIKDLTKLTKLFLWNSKVTESGVAKLKKALPKTDISFGG